MHNSNAYYMRMINAEAEVRVLTDRGSKLAAQHEDLLKSQWFALQTLRTLATVALSRRHRAVSAIARVLRIKPEITPEKIRAMLNIITHALDSQPAPSMSEPSPEPSPEIPEPEPDPSEPSGAEKLRVIRGGLDA